MSKIEYRVQRSRFAMIGVVMTIVSLVFLFYVGSSLVSSTKKYHQQRTEFTSRM